MKVVILGDPHFGGGYSLGKNDLYRQLNSRLIDFSNTFDYVIDYLINNEVFHLIITGDVFENRRPQASELALFSEKIARLSELKIHTYIVAGNHDIIIDQKATTLDVLDVLKVYLPYVHIYSDIGNVECRDETGAISFVFFPFRTKQTLASTSNDMAVQRLKDSLQFELNEISDTNPKILVGHFMLQNTILGNAIKDNHPGDVVLPPSMFDKFDAVIMGHVHPHQIIQKDPLVSYIGSMERKDFGEAKNNKYLLLVEQNDKLTFTFEKLPVRELHDVVLDQSAEINNVFENIKEYFTNYAAEHKMSESIVRLTVLLNEKNVYEINKEEIIEYMKKELSIYHCVGVYPQIISKRQLRKSSITEKNNPMVSFLEYLELEENIELKEKMKEIGVKIIAERYKYDSD
jgi:exonuclease SbcD